jgi:hypothetical protein
VPRAVGENVTPTRHQLFAGTLAPHFLLVLAAIAKSPPEMVMLLNVTVASVAFWNTTSFSAVVLPTETNSQLKLGGSTAMGTV